MKTLYKHGPLKPNIKARWLKALRSGKYQQGKGELRSRDNKFCCLGVLCDLYAEDHGIEWDTLPGGFFTFMDHTGLLPREVKNWAGFKFPDGGGLVIGTIRNTIVEHNDAGVPFSELADLIEEQL